MNLSDARRARLLQLQWYALRVKAQKETAAGLMLKRRGVTAFVPTGWHPKRVCYRSKRRVEITRPFLMRYVLAGFSGEVAWWEVERMSIFVEGVVGINGTPSAIPMSAMGALLAAHESESLVPESVQERPARRKRFKRCRVAQVLDGLMRGEIVTVDEIRGNKAAVRRQDNHGFRSVWMPVDNLEPIE